MISAIILTKNEEKNISDCIQSVSFCGEIIVVDDYSTDTTVKIARKKGAKVFSRKLDSNFSAQRNFALSKAHRDWVLFVDADERVTPELAMEISKVVDSDALIDGYMFKRQDVVLGKKVSHGEFGANYLLRLARKGSGEWFRSVHEFWQIKGEKKKLVNSLLHYSHTNLHELISSVNRWSTEHALANKSEGKYSNLFKVVLMPPAHFVKNYIYRLGFLDGVIGFVLAVLMSFHSFLSWGKLWMLQKGFTKI